MCRVSSYTLAVLALWAGSSRAQYIGPGSTTQGDYLRGVGVAAYGKRWPIALRTDDFAVERREYERAIDHALEQQVEGKVHPEAIVAVEKAVAALEGKRHRVNRADNDVLTIETRDFLRELARVP